MIGMKLNYFERFNAINYIIHPVNITYLLYWALHANLLVTLITTTLAV